MLARPLLGSRLNSERVDSLASLLTHPRPSGFAIYVARVPAAPLYRAVPAAVDC